MPCFEEAAPPAAVLLRGAAFLHAHTTSLSSYGCLLSRSLLSRCFLLASVFRFPSSVHLDFIRCPPFPYTYCPATGGWSWTLRSGGGCLWRRRPSGGGAWGGFCKPFRPS